MLFRFATLLAALLLPLGPLSAHEGHDHGDAPSAAALTQGAPRAEAHSENFEAVAVAAGGQVTLWLDRFATNEPVTDATVDVETPAGPTKAATQKDGSYRLDAPWLAAGGSIDLVLTVTAGGTVDILPLHFDLPVNGGSAQAQANWSERLLGRVTPVTAGILAFGLVLGVILTLILRPRAAVAAIAVLLLAPNTGRAHEGHDHGEPAAAVMTGDRAARLPDGSVFVPKPSQRLYGLRTILTKQNDSPRAVELPGRVIADPNASGFVQASVGGRLSPPSSGFPRLGARVKAGDVLAQVEPPIQMIDVSDMRQRQGELDQQAAIVARRLARFEALVTSGAVARSQVEETRLELDGLRERRAFLDNIRREPELLLAPVSGVIGEGTAVPGQIVASNAVVFHIVDPRKLWVEALSFQTLADVVSASARTATGETLPLSFRGSGVAARSQSIPVHFAVDDKGEGLRVGEFLTVVAQYGAPRAGIAVPRNALTRASNGQWQVYEQVAAERFVARAVRTEPLDAETVLVLAGLEPGRRIVVQGADLVDHVR